MRSSWSTYIYRVLSIASFDSKHWGCSHEWESLLLRFSYYSKRQSLSKSTINTLRILDLNKSHQEDGGRHLPSERRCSLRGGHIWVGVIMTWEAAAVQRLRRSAWSRRKSQGKGPKTRTSLACSRARRRQGWLQCCEEIPEWEQAGELVKLRHPLDLVRVWILFWIKWAFAGVLVRPDLHLEHNSDCWVKVGLKGKRREEILGR